MSRARPTGAVIDVTPPEAVAGDAQAEAEIAMGQPVGGSPQAFQPPFQETPAPVAEAASKLTEAQNAEKVREHWAIQPGAPVPIALRTVAEKRAAQTGPRQDVSKPPTLHVAPPETSPFAAAAAAPKDLDALLKLAAKAAIDAEDDEALDGIRMVQADRKKRSAELHKAEAEMRSAMAAPGTAEGSQRRG